MAGYNHQQIEQNVRISRYGPARTITAAVASTENATALIPGQYLFRVETESVRFRASATGGTAVATDQLAEAGDTFVLTIGAKTAERFFQIIRAGAADSKVTVCGIDANTAASQPPAWA